LATRNSSFQESQVCGGLSHATGHKGLSFRECRFHSSSPTVVNCLLC
jgi:hypothetical protein